MAFQAASPVLAHEMSTNSAPPKISETRKLGLIAIIALVIAGLGTVDRFLERAQNSEVKRLAERSYLDGLRFQRDGKLNEAVEAFRKAHSLERRNSEYELQLINALIEARKPEEADLLMREILDREPNNGRANLDAAHLMIAEGKVIEAESYYHRAIYGEWPDNALAHRIAVRMELADFLAARGKQEELLAELLPLQEEAGKDPSAQRRIAQLFLAAGSPSRAADEYRVLIKHNPKDADAYAGLGEAELKMGNYRAGREAFLSAAARKPQEPSIQKKVELATTLSALDPTARRLTSHEKYRRSMQILELARDDLQSCLSKNPSGASDATQQLLVSVNNTLAKKAPASVTNELAEQILSLADDTLQARIKLCGKGVAPGEEPLRLIMEKIAQ